MSNPVNASTDQGSGLRYYTWNDRRLVSVTSVRRVVGMPFALANWQVKQVVEAAVATHGAAETEALGDDDYAKVLRGAATLKRDEAASLGTAVHEAAEQGLRAAGMEALDPRQPFLLQYELWQREMKPRILLNEGQVFNLDEGYAGSFDLVADMPPQKWVEAGPLPKRTLIDLKTGSGIYNDHAIQLALYFGAQFVGGYDPILDEDVQDDKATAIFDGITDAAILHLRPDGYEFIPIPITDELAAAALDMVHLCRWYLNHPTIDTLKGAL